MFLKPQVGQCNLLSHTHKSVLIDTITVSKNHLVKVFAQGFWKSLNISSFDLTILPSYSIDALLLLSFHSVEMSQDKDKIREINWYLHSFLKGQIKWNKISSIKWLIYWKGGSIIFQSLLPNQLHWKFNLTNGMDIQFVTRLSLSESI